jgi:hypothetical protein
MRNIQEAMPNGSRGGFVTAAPKQMSELLSSGSEGGVTLKNVRHQILPGVAKPLQNQLAPVAVPQAVCSRRRARL